MSSDVSYIPINVTTPELYEVLASVFIDALGVDNPEHHQIAALYIDQDLYQDRYLAAARLLTKVADGSTQYRESSAILTTIALMNTLEGFEHLQGKLRKIQAFFAQNEGTLSFMYATVDTIAKPLLQAIQGDPEALHDLVLPITVLEEILEYDPTVAQYMADGIYCMVDDFLRVA